MSSSNFEKTTQSSSINNLIHAPDIEGQAIEPKEDVSQEAIDKFLPSNIPHRYLDGRIPLRIQILNDKKVLQTVLSKPKKGVYMCSHCNTSFPNFGLILDHFDAFDIQRPYKCYIEDCPWKIVGFNKSRQLQRHTTSVHSAREYRCEVVGCERMFKRMDLLNRHTKSVHENLNSRFNKKLGRTSAPSSASSSPSINLKELDEQNDQKPSQAIPLIQKSYSTSSISSNSNLKSLINDEEYPLPNYTSDSIKSTKLLPKKRRHSLSKISLPKKTKYGDAYKHSINFLTHPEED